MFSNSVNRRDARGGRRGERGFTLAEALAALAFLAIVIPVAVEGLHIAQNAGQAAQRKVIAARIADRVLNEIVVTGRWKQSSLSGTTEEGPYSFRWQMRADTWREDTLRLLTVMVTYGVQGREHEVRLSTVVDNGTQ